MAKILLTQESRDEDFAKKILKQIHNKSDLARNVGISKQSMNYRFKCVYPKAIVELMHILDAAGYEITKKE